MTAHAGIKRAIAHCVQRATESQRHRENRILCDSVSLWLVVAVSAVIALAGAISAEPTPLQEPAKTVWDGAYTDAQAGRGEARYETTCSRCHRDGPRRGEAFMRDWSGTDVESVFRRIKTSMPPDAPSSLSDAEYLDIVAYILRTNGFPAGREELRTETIKTRIQGRDGVGPVPNFALARVVGCLTESGERIWVLTNAGEPVRTKNPAASTDDERGESEKAALGTQTIELLNIFPRPDAYKGHKIEAKGFLIRNPGGDRINVTSVQSLGPECH
jgi:mono/diheme cytochrome c family protein